MQLLGNYSWSTVPGSLIRHLLLLLLLNLAFSSEAVEFSENATPKDELILALARVPVGLASNFHSNITNSLIPSTDEQQQTKLIRNPVEDDKVTSGRVLVRPTPQSTSSTIPWRVERMLHLWVSSLKKLCWDFGRRRGTDIETGKWGKY